MFKRGWEPGQATIVARRDSKGLARLRDTEFGRSWSYDYVADVRPDNGDPAFRATFSVHFGSSFRSGGRRPAEGEQARVLFDPKSHKVEFDRDALNEDKKNAKEAAADAFAAAAAQAPGTPPPSESTAGATESSTGEAQMLDAITRAREAGDHAEVERLQAEFLAQRDHGSGD